jgi:hypothetical protein
MEQKKQHTGKPGDTTDPAALPTVYPPGEDMYNQLEKLEDVDPGDTSKLKDENDDDSAGIANEKNFSSDVSGSDLDIPGAELDDDEEATGNEDEENNHYSIGGDNHNDLDEDSRQ